MLLRQRVKNPNNGVGSQKQRGKPMLKKLISRVTSDRPELVIVVYDNQYNTFSRPQPRAVKRLVAVQSALMSSRARVRAILRPRHDDVTHIEDINVFHAETRDDVGREYILVVGHHFSFGGRLGRDFFDPKTDLSRKFGEPDGLIVQNMIDTFLESLKKKKLRA
jgi:hypothetical protein